MSLHAHPALAHELRTPLHGVLASVALLRDTPLSDAQREHVETIGEAAAALLRLADETLGVGVAESARCEVRPVVDGVRRLLAATAQARGLTLTAGVDDAVPAVLAVPAGRVRQVLVNLVGNALKCTDHGGVTLTATRRAGTVVFEVRDTGRGLTTGEAAALFTPYGRPATGDAYAVGLGLAISADVVRALHGTIGARPGADGGSVFWVALPDAEPHAPLERPETPAPMDRGPACVASATTILVVDDDPVSARVTARMVERMGAVAHVVHGVDAARAALGARDWDAVLADWQLADGTGADVAAAVRADPRHSYAIVLGLTASADAGMRRRCLDAGMNDCLFKPLPLDALERALAHWLPVDRVAAPELLDPARVDALARLDADAPGLFARIAVDYARESTRLLDGIEVALAARDAAAVARMAHALRGSSASAGAARAAGLAEAIERVAVFAGERAPEDLAGALDAVEALRRAVSTATVALRELAAGPSLRDSSMCVGDVR